MPLLTAPYGTSPHIPSECSGDLIAFTHLLRGHFYRPKRKIQALCLDAYILKHYA